MDESIYDSPLQNAIFEHISNLHLGVFDASNIQLTLGKVELGVVMVPPLESEERPCWGGGGPVVMEGGRAKAGEGKGEGS